MKRKFTVLYIRVEIQEEILGDYVLSELIPELNTLKEKGFICGYWFIRKKDPINHLRIRIHNISSAKEHVFQLIKRKLINIGFPNIYRIVYEPEKCLFGGENGMDLAHEFFMIDSSFILGFINISSDSKKKLSLNNLSLWVWKEILKELDLDLFEQWDIWCFISNLRTNTNSVDNLLWEKNKEALQKVMRYNLATIDDSLGVFINTNIQEYKAWSRKMSMAEKRGKLNRGLRSIIALHIIFHWNRIGLSYDMQCNYASLLKTMYNPERIIKEGFNV